jgi:hypothetical protein
MSAIAPKSDRDSDRPDGRYVPLATEVQRSKKRPIRSPRSQARAVCQELRDIALDRRFRAHRPSPALCPKVTQPHIVQPA